MGKKETIELLVEGGNAKPGPTIAPKLSQLKLNVGEVIKEINEKTKQFSGMQVPVKLIVDLETKEYEIEIGLPPVTSLVKKELNIETAAHNPGKETVGDLPIEKVIEIARLKMKDMNTKDLKSSVKMVLGTLVSMGVTVNGKNPKEVIKEVNEGKYDELIK
ncbi:50S ribosomal protein L11 [Nanoarchaeota archaeon NZ13-N]|uniref:Large ribosomal subunit protein uL11 n=1 Tax=Candidatus Nanoclepta minutus TaxID=1940235 RepID=A0A397WNG8_9ARCH|nr:MAG: 50S ribosomal protein L11 [Nanoarchaeota archaeon NZ13-N]RIB35624.1 MAG: 50S ribosomal protein L11 [Candidatus Nanoclepta minutus]